MFAISPVSLGIDKETFLGLLEVDQVGLSKAVILINTGLFMPTFLSILTH